MLEVASKTPVSVGSIAWPRYANGASIIVKAAFDLRVDGSVTPSLEKLPLSLDVRSSDGALVYPSDFAPEKPVAEVLVVGDEGRPSEVPATLALGPLSATAHHVGPVAAHDPRETGWSVPEFNFVRFQSARPEQRVPRITFPLRLAFSRGPLSLVQRVDLSPPALMIVERSGDGWSSEEPLHVALTCDTLLVDPRRRSLVAIFRGYAEPRNGWRPETLLVASATGRLDGIGPSDIEAWPRGRVVRFEDLLLSSQALLGGGASIENPESSTIDSVKEIAEDDDEMSSTIKATSSPAAASAPRVRQPARTQPMNAGDVARALERTRGVAMSPPSAPRFGAPPSSAEPEYTGRETVAVPANLRGSALPFVAGRFEPTGAPNDEDEGGDDPIGSGTLPIDAMSPVQALRATQAAAPRVASTLPLPSLSRAQIDAIRSELAAAPLSRAAILDRYGLSEMVWRAIAINP